MLTSDPLLTVEDVMATLGVAADAARQAMADAGRIKIGNRIRVRRSRLDAWLRARESGEHSVYFVRAVGVALIKIGIAIDVESRLVNQRGASPIPLELIGAVPNVSMFYEARLHEQWAHIRSHSEWFHATPELEAFIAAALAGCASCVPTGVQTDSADSTVQHENTEES
jgi:hypothetical protein